LDSRAPDAASKILVSPERIGLLIWSRADGNIDQSSSQSNRDRALDDYLKMAGVRIAELRTVCYRNFFLRAIVEFAQYRGDISDGIVLLILAMTHNLSSIQRSMENTLK
jgi:hypothetical protein